MKNLLGSHAGGEKITRFRFRTVRADLKLDNESRGTMVPLGSRSQRKQAVGALNRMLRGMLWEIQPAQWRFLCVLGKW